MNKPASQFRFMARTCAKPFTLLVSIAALAACSTEPTTASPTVDASPLPTGTTLHYVRSNQDGTKPEDIYVHIVSETELAVMKRIAPCMDAALVTAAFNPATGEARALTGARLGRDTQQVPQAFLRFDPATREFAIRFGDPDKLEPDLIQTAPSAPWRMYDFDLAEFALFGPRGDNAMSDFSFGFAMTWPADNAPPFQMLGKVEAQYDQSIWGYSGGPSVNRYQLTGPEFGDGELVLSAKSGAVVSARFSRPNHPGYHDFSLKLQDTLPDQAAWTNLLTSHWVGCPARSE